MALQGGLSKEPASRAGFACRGPRQIGAAWPSLLGLRVNARGLNARAATDALNGGGLRGTATPAGARLMRGVVWASDPLIGEGPAGAVVPARAGLGRGVVAGGRRERSPQGTCGRPRQRLQHQGRGGGGGEWGPPEISKTPRGTSGAIKQCSARLLLALALALVLVLVLVRVPMPTMMML